MLDPNGPVGQHALVIASGRLREAEWSTVRTTLWLVLALALFAAAAYWVPTLDAEHRVAELARTSPES